MAGDDGANTSNNPAPTVQANATNESILALVSSFALQNSIAGLRPFNGTDWPLKDFIQDVRNGEAGVPENQKLNYLRVVIGKLRGAARDSTYGEDFNTVEDLIKHLKARFAPGRDYAFYVEKLNNVRMTDNQKIGDFKDQIRILMDNATSALKTELGDTFNEVMMTPLKSMVLNIFIKGLPPQLSERVDMSHPASIEEAYKEAIRLDSRMEAGIIPDKRYQSYRNNQSYDGQRRPRNNFYQRNTYNNGQNSSHSSNGPFMGQINDQNNYNNHQQQHNNQNVSMDPSQQQNSYNPNGFRPRNNYNNYNSNSNYNNGPRNNFQQRRNNFNPNKNRNHTFDPDASIRDHSSQQDYGNSNFRNRNGRFNQYQRNHQYSQNSQHRNFNNGPQNNFGQQPNYSNNQPNYQDQQRNNISQQTAQCQPIVDHSQQQHLNQYVTCPTAAPVGQPQSQSSQLQQPTTSVMKISSVVAMSPELRKANRMKHQE